MKFFFYYYYIKKKTKVLEFIFINKINKMDYKNQLQEHFQGNNVIDLTTLIEGIVVLFGNTKDVKRDNPSVVMTSSEMHISEKNLQMILNQVLTKDGADMAFAIHNIESFKKFKFEYNVQEGQAYISLK